MNFSGQRILLCGWYLTPTHLIFAGQRRKRDQGKTWGWMLSGWRVSSVLWHPFLVMETMKKSSLEKNNVFLLLWDCLKYQRQKPWNTRSGLPGCSERDGRVWFLDFWMETIDQFLGWYKPIYLVKQPSNSHRQTSVFSLLALRPALPRRFHCNRLLHGGKQHLVDAVIRANIPTAKRSSAVNK